MSQILKDFLKSIAPFTEDELNMFVEKGQRKEAESGRELFRPDRPFLRLWFLEKGIIRAFRLIDGKDITFFFYFKNEFAVDYESYLTEATSPLFFEALTDCRYLEFSKASIQFMYEEYIRFEKLGRIMAERAYLSATHRLKQLQAEPLEVRYQKLLIKDPHLFQQIPQYHIASYLGVSPQSLSRIRAKMNQKYY
jgi:CRP-like cAMP-binding protein